MFDFGQRNQLLSRKASHDSLDYNQGEDLKVFA
jgi:hypothetical protein